MFYNYKKVEYYNVEVFNIVEINSLFDGFVVFVDICDKTSIHSACNCI